MIGETVTRQAYTPAVNAHGAPVDAWGTGASVWVYAFDPGSSSEPRIPGHDRVIVEPTAYMPSTVVWGPRDRITARSKVYEVEGEARQWVSPFTGEARGNVVTLRRVDG